MQMKETVEKHIVMSLDYMDPAPSRKTTTRRKFSCEKKETKLAGQAA
jgi:hypothetical protein